MRIHTIGDSHSYAGWNYMPYVAQHHIGPKLCFSIGRDGIDISRFNIQENDIVIFCFGEIDCRCHIHKHVGDTHTYESIIDNIVEQYIKSVINATKQIQIKPCIYNVVPPVEKHTIHENGAYPHLGSDEERKSYVLYFNKKLKEMCALNNIIFFDIYDKYIDSRGFLNKSLSDGEVHIRNGVYMKQFLEQHILQMTLH